MTWLARQGEQYTLRLSLRAIPDRTRSNAADDTARPVAISVAVVLAVIVIPAVMIIMMMVMTTVRVPLVALSFPLAPHLHDVVRASELRDRSGYGPGRGHCG
jgi:hypothetical protein